MTKFRINLTIIEKEHLKSMVKKGKHNSRNIQYAHILLSSDESNGNTPLNASTISERYFVSTKTVERIRKQFCEEGMGIFEPVLRKTRSDKKFDARVEAHLISLCCQSPPNESPHWKLQLLADRLVELNVVDSISKSSVCTLLKKTNLSPFKRNSM